MLDSECVNWEYWIKMNKTAQMQQDAALALPEDGFKTIYWWGKGFQFIDQVEVAQLDDRMKILCRASDPENAINLAILVTDADDKTFFSDGAAFNGTRFKFIDQRTIECCNFFGTDKKCLHGMPSVVVNGISRPDLVGYAQKYMHKSILKTALTAVS